MSIIMQALTSNDDLEIKWCLDNLKNTTAGTYFIHESFHKDDPNNFTRKWYITIINIRFAWANTLFGELIMKISNEKPHLIF
jgi:meiotically up-regulated gene 157 (Mug157) protein